MSVSTDLQSNVDLDATSGRKMVAQLRHRPCLGTPRDRWRLPRPIVSNWNTMLLVGVLFFAVWHSATTQAQDEPKRIADDASQTAWKLVDQLGSPNFATREGAKRKLLRMREDAFEVLLEARNHENAEIRLTIRDLLDSVDVAWVQASDPPAVASVMRDYAGKSVNERKAITQQLARLDESWESWVLLRIARFDSSDAISKWAALQLLRHCDHRERDADWLLALEKRSAGSRRAAVVWLADFPKLVRRESGADERFERHLEKELDAASRQDQTEGIDRTLTLDLCRWYTEWTLERDPDKDASKLVGEALWLIPFNEPAVKEQLDWLIHLNQEKTVAEWCEAQGKRLEDWPEVQFRTAEAYRLLGDEERTLQWESRAVEALPRSLEDRETIAHGLNALDYPDWGIRVLRDVLDDVDPVVAQDWRVRRDLATWLDDQCRWQEAFETLDTAIRFADSRDDGWNSLPKVDQQSALRAEAHRFRALALRDASPNLNPEFAAVVDAGLKHQPTHIGLLVLKLQSIEPGQKPDAAFQNRVDLTFGRLEDRLRKIKEDLDRFPVPHVRLRLEQEELLRTISLAKLTAAAGDNVEPVIATCLRLLNHREMEPELHYAVALCYQADQQRSAALESVRQALALRPSCLRYQRLIKEIESDSP